MTSEERLVKLLKAYEKKLKEFMTEQEYADFIGRTAQTLWREDIESMEAGELKDFCREHFLDIACEDEDDEDEQENCEITNEPCPVCFEYYECCYDACPIGRYEEGSYYYSQEEIERQRKKHPEQEPAKCIRTNTCRYYGSWAERLIGKRLVSEGD